MFNLLVTGGSGMIGSRLIQLLPQDINLIHNLDRINGFDILNLSDMLTKLEHQQIDVIIHFAAFTDVTSAEQQNRNLNGSCYQINVIGTKNITHLASSLDARLIHVSTDFVFDGNKGSQYIEEDKPNPIGWYAQTKYLAEELVMNSSTKWTIIRTAFPFLAKFPTKLDLIRGLIKKIKDQDLPPQFTDHIITPTFIDQLATAIFSIVRKRATGVYHLVGNDALSDCQIAQTISEVFNLPTQISPSSVIEFNVSADRPYAKNTSLSNEKFSREFGINFTTLTESLEKIKSQGVDVLA